MGRSQRHSIYIRGNDASGKGVSEKLAANVYLAQYIASQAFTVPVGPSGGPLQGSSVAGFPPTLIPPPGLYEARDAELNTSGEFTDSGQFNLSGNPIYQDLPGPGSSIPPMPLPGEEPVLNSINPNSAKIGDPDLTMNVNGNRFTDTSVIYFNGGPENTTFISSGQLSTIVKPSTASVPGSYPVWVQEGSYQTSSKTFTFTDPQVTPLGRTFPLGPLTIVNIDDHDAGIAIELAEGDVRVGDTVLVEATGNTSINGSYPVLSVEGLTIVVDNPVVLSAPIEAKGRLTVTEGAA